MKHKHAIDFPEWLEQEKERKHKEEEFLAEIWAETMPAHFIVSEWDMPSKTGPASVWELAK